MMSLLPVFSKTRIAPTPSGFLHLGNILSFALTAALARKTGAGILLRIDDLDTGRVRREYVEDIFDTLRFLGIPWDEGPRDFEEYERLYSQRHRVDQYMESLRLLGASGAVFGCTCSRSYISGSRTAPSPEKGSGFSANIPQADTKAATGCAGRLAGPPAEIQGDPTRTAADHAGKQAGLAAKDPNGYTTTGAIPVTGYPGTCRSAGIPLNTPGINWRLLTAPDMRLEVKTLAGPPVPAVLPAGMKDFVVRKKDGLPAYQLSSVLDDLWYGVDFIVRGEDLWESTLAQLYLSGFLPENGFRDICFYHHSLLTEGDGKKLSKSEGAGSVQYLRRQGRTPAEIYALIAAGMGSSEKPGTWLELGEMLFTRGIT